MSFALVGPVSGLLGQLPTRAGVHIRQQAEQEGPRLPARLHPPEPTRDPGERRVELGQPSLGVYAVASGHRKIFGCLHKSSMIMPWPHPPLQARRPRR